MPTAWSRKIDIGRKVGSSCLVGMQVQNGKFVRVDPVKPGTFDCDDNKPALTLTIDPAAGVPRIARTAAAVRKLRHVDSTRTSCAGRC